MSPTTQVENPVNQQSLTGLSGRTVSGVVSNADNAASVPTPNPRYLHLIAQMDQMSQALAALGITEEDLMEALPAARAEYMEETYSQAFLQHLEQAWRTLHPEAQGE
jgi:hypothetical protein